MVFDGFIHSESGVPMSSLKLQLPSNTHELLYTLTGLLIIFTYEPQIQTLPATYCVLLGVMVARQFEVVHCVLDVQEFPPIEHVPTLFHALYP